MNGTPRRNLRLTTAALVTTLLAVSGLPTSFSTGSGSPEISDASGDANPGAFYVNNPGNASAFANLSAYDLLIVYVLVETADSFAIEFEVKDLPDAWAQDAPVPVKPNATQPAVSLVANFTVKGTTYTAQASLVKPSAGGLRDTYELRWPGGSQALSGTFNAVADTVTLIIPKKAIQNPTYGDKLTKFRAEGRFGNSTLDFAPDAVNYQVGQTTADALLVLLNKLTGQQLVEPKFGADYTFGNYPGSVSADIRLSTDDNSKELGAGSSMVYYFQVENRAPVSDTVTLALSAPTDAGFDHSLSVPRANIPAGGKQVLELAVAAASGLSGTFTSRVSAISQLGDAEELSFLTVVRSPAGDDGSDGGGTSGTSDGTGGSSGSGGSSEGSGSAEGGGKSKGKSPGPAFWAMLIVGIGVAMALRRRLR